MRGAVLSAQRRPGELPQRVPGPAVGHPGRGDRVGDPAVEFASQRQVGSTPPPGSGYLAEVSSDASADQVAQLLEAVDRVAEIPQAIRAEAQCSALAERASAPSAA